MIIVSFIKSLVLILAAALSLSGCGIFDKSTGKDVISVGDRFISEEELRKEIQLVIFEMGITDIEVKQGIKSIINKVVEKALIKEYGKEEGITISDQELESAIKVIQNDYSDGIFQEMLLKRYIEYDEWKRNIGEELLIQKIISKAVENIPPVSTEEIINYFESHRETFRHPQMVQVIQIVAESNEDAEKILSLLKEGHSMQELAKQYSSTPEAQNGGELGWIAKGELEEPMEKIIFSISPGSVSNIFKSLYGYHIFKIQSRRDEGLDELPEVMEEIRSTLMLEKRDFFYVDWINKLRDRFPVTINPIVYNIWEMEGPA